MPPDPHSDSPDDDARRGLRPDRDPHPADRAGDRNPPGGSGQFAAGWSLDGAAPGPGLAAALGCARTGLGILSDDALAGVLGATLFSFNPGFGASELLKSFVVVVLGGLGSVAGTAVAALILASVEVFAILLLPSYLTAAVGFVLLVLVLVLRPGGLFGHRVLG